MRPPNGNCLLNLERGSWRRSLRGGLGRKLVQPEPEDTDVQDNGAVEDNRGQVLRHVAAEFHFSTVEFFEREEHRVFKSDPPDLTPSRAPDMSAHIDVDSVVFQVLSTSFSYFTVLQAMNEE